MVKIKAFIKRHPVLAYYTLVFAISWGCILIVLGPGGFLGTTQVFSVQLYIGGPLSLLGPYKIHAGFPSSYPTAFRAPFPFPSTQCLAVKNLFLSIKP